MRPSVAFCASCECSIHSDHHLSQPLSAFRKVCICTQHQSSLHCMWLMRRVELCVCRRWEVKTWVRTHLSMPVNTSTVQRRRQTYRGNLSIVPGGCSRSRSCGRRLLSRRLHGGRLPQLPVGLQGGEVVDRCKLNQGGEDEGKANSDEPIHCCGVRNFGEGVAGADTERGHGQDGGDPCAQEGDRRQEHAAHTDGLVTIWVSLNFKEDILWNIPGSSLQTVGWWDRYHLSVCASHMKLEQDAVS